ncbi:RING-type domain-containing protein [Caenorhabditis elegans]|uniref:RING-type domain-containing protein n=1 Tax=Caenorhabditis elegans TaxID=6239 RepID=O16681_CAEEL|nr:RING-type domain-containing protein [Caenorhabditis elegans]CCD61647.1 RING-type domain-containing protein [Caenorhabditis elegans]|eukprot:NP_494240.1 Uncharacterized protein CELE_ZK1240.6 [Caenorhabditis elegans]
MALFECKVCNENYSDVDESHVPRVLTCGHSICQSCAAKQMSNSLILCKTCPEETITKVRDGDVRNLQKNFGLMQTIEMFQQDLPLKCKEHQYNLAEFVCIEPDCPSIDKSMCRACEEFGVHTGHVMRG